MTKIFYWFTCTISKCYKQNFHLISWVCSLSQLWSDTHLNNNKNSTIMQMHYDTCQNKLQHCCKNNLILLFWYFRGCVLFKYMMRWCAREECPDASWTSESWFATGSERVLLPETRLSNIIMSTTDGSIFQYIDSIFNILNCIVSGTWISNFWLLLHIQVSQ